MIYLSVLLLCLSAAGVLAMAWRYATSPIPLDYHNEVFRQSGVPVPPANLLIVETLCRAFAGALFGVGVLIIAMALGPVLQGHIWASFVTLAAALAVGVPCAIYPWKVERRTGVRAPWRIAVVLTLLVIAAFVTSFL